MSCKTAPNEILIKIFSLLDKKDMYPLIYVCKQWHMAVVPLYFQNIHITKIPIERDVIFSNGYFTQELTISSVYDEDDMAIPIVPDKPTSSLLFLSLPNLKKLDLQSYVNPAHYTSILQDITDIDMYLRYIEEIGFRRSTGEDSLSHFLVCYKFRKSIRRLETHVSSNALMSATSKGLNYFLPQFMFLTQLTIFHQPGDDITLFDILICCENIIDLNYTSRGLVPFRANSQVGCTSNKHLKRLTIFSQFSPPAYIDYLRIIPTLEYLNLTIFQDYDGDAFRLFSVIEPFADEFQKFKELRINFNGVQRLSFPPSLANVFYSVLCKLKGDGNRLYDATLCTRSFATDNVIAIHDGKLSFKYISEHERLIGSHCIGNIKKIVKGLTFTKDQFPYWEILDYAKEFPRLENLYLSTRLFDFRIIGSEIIISCSNPWGAILDQFHAYSPKAETVTFDRNDIFCTRSTRTLTWDLTVYKNLKVFNFHVNPVKARDYDFVFIKFEYDDFHCYKRIVFHNDKKKNIPVTISSSLERTNYIRNVTIKLHSRSVKINCAPNNLFTLESVAYS